MELNDITPRRFPRQRLSMMKKNKQWRKDCVDWGIYNLYKFDDSCRKTIRNKRINHDLINGILHMDDLESYVNPFRVEDKYNINRDPIQHFNLMLNKLNVLRGEERARVFDYKVVVTNPNVVSDIAENKKNQLMNELKSAIEDQGLDEEQFQEEIQKISKYYTYSWQDIRELRGNAILNHYSKELNFDSMFNDGFMTALWSGEEIYRCYINGGEPAVERVDPYKLMVLSSGRSNKIEDANMLIYNDYWPIEKVYDVYGDKLTKKDMEYLEDRLYRRDDDDFDSVNDYNFFQKYKEATILSDTTIVSNEQDTIDTEWDDDFSQYTQLPYDMSGNVRVTQIWWKSRKRLKKIKHYDPMTGDVEFTIMNEAYIPDENNGEEEEDLWTNEAWHGVKIGSCIYVDMAPCEVQYNRLSNPSLCHFGFIGSVYNQNGSRPFTLVDMMKPYNYLYDVVFDKLMKTMATNMGKLVRMDLAKIPQDKGWDVSKWMYFAKVHGIAVEDSFNEGDYGAATGKLAGGLNNATTGVIDAELGNTIQSYIQLLSYIEEQLSISGISKQREGQIDNRETVGGVERATLQSSHITEWLFAMHDDVKKRVLECFLETAKVALKDKKEKFQYIIPGWVQKVADIDGDEFAECDYGLVVDNSREIQELSQKLDMLVQAGIQNQLLDFSTALQLYTSCSMAEKINIIRNSEEEQQKRIQQQQEQAQKLQDETLKAQRQMEFAKMEQEDKINERDNETKIQIAIINAESKKDEFEYLNIEKNNEDITDKREKRMLSEREFEASLQQEKEKLAWEKQKNKDNNDVKLQIARMKPKTTGGSSK